MAAHSSDYNPTVRR